MDPGFRFNWGDIVKDKITGFTGQITGATSYVTGCNTYLVQPRLDNDGKWVNARWMDDERLELLQGAHRTEPMCAGKPGGDMVAPTK